ncbi:segregation and condensation protein A [Sulfoacidibacillus thermotolerans]|uniref:Segregation and condensation protein A n=1 Tax=Sulfoacidibacillus thermotolerans TaxID=1765684 RepID=A0A2U3D5P9_SULT2|nr:segregation/condensation protein A [Sulfoacidibacillus thermotolerans]PWI56616.1 hypothetical protein BM613_12825 [Sulfoacidibacillus thermotolerans]
MKEPQNYQISLQSFEGPLDMLLHFIESDKLDIHEIPIAKVTDQYMAYLNQSLEFELEIASEFLVMAATLIAIKARSLLPKRIEQNPQNPGDLDAENDPEQDLKERLLEYKAFKMVALTLEQKQVQRAEHIGRLPTALEPYRELPTVSDFLAGLELSHLQEVVLRVLTRSQKTVDVSVVRDRETIPERMNTILKTLQKGSTTFFALTKNRQRKEIVTVFLAILELIRLNKIICRQEAKFGDIWIELKKTN